MRQRGDRDSGPPLSKDCGAPQIPQSTSIRRLRARHAQIAQAEAGWAKITAGNELVNSLLRHSECDLMATDGSRRARHFIMAGIPWFATLFGRDSIIAALSVLPFSPAVAAGTLRTLARFQGTEVNADRDEQPGKIVHEMRCGRDGGAARNSLRPLLRQRRFDAALLVAVRSLCRGHGRLEAGRRNSGRTSSARSNGSRNTATPTATATSSTCAKLRRDSPTRAGRIPSIRSPMPTERSRAPPSRCVRSRATCTRLILRSRRWPRE